MTRRYKWAGTGPAVLAAAVVALSVGCIPGLEALRHPPVETAVTTSGVWSSMIYLTRIDRGVLAVDLGWMGSDAALREGLAALGATEEDIRFVLVTHSHRDHIGAWRRVRGATFFLSAPESALFVGAAQHRGPVTRLTEALRRTRLPAPGELAVRTFTGDTTIVFGDDTVRAFGVPGHTAGSAAYLVRGRLFVGDAVSMLPLIGFRRARWMYSDDVARSTASMRRLWQQLPVDSSRLVCTAHGKCAADTDSLRSAALR